MTRSSVKKIFIVLFIIILIGIAVLSFLFFKSGFYNNLLNRQNEGTKNEPSDEIKTAIKGKLFNTAEGLTVLDIKGTESEMGYAHGFLLGHKIKYMVEYTVWLSKSLDNYNSLHDNIVPNYLLRSSGNYKDELKAILQGAVASGADMYVESLGRNWDITDLWVINTIPDWAGAGCSGVGLWGSCTENGQTLIGRNLDFFVDPNGYLNQLYVMIIFRGNNNRYDIVSFALPGYIGIISGFNTKGVWVQIDMSNGGVIDKKQRNGICLANRRFLESNDGTDIESRSQNFYLEQNLFSSMLLMIGSNNTSDNSSPVFVLEIRDDSVGFRGETNPSDDYVILTNHERVNQSPIECDRYSRYVSELNEYKAMGDKKIDCDELLLSQQHNGHRFTINAIQFYPSSLTFRIGFSRTKALKDGELWSDDDIAGGPWDKLLETWFSWDMFK